MKMFPDGNSARKYIENILKKFVGMAMLFVLFAVLTMLQSARALVKVIFVVTVAVKSLQ